MNCEFCGKFVPYKSRGWHYRQHVIKGEVLERMEYRNGRWGLARHWVGEKKEEPNAGSSQS